METHPALKWGAIAGVVALGTLAALATPAFIAVAKAIRTQQNAETLTSQSFPLEPSALEPSAFCYKEGGFRQHPPHPKSRGRTKSRGRRSHYNSLLPVPCSPFPIPTKLIRVEAIAFIGTTQSTTSV
jgi:hypothetical protein